MARFERRIQRQRARQAVAGDLPPVGRFKAEWGPFYFTSEESRDRARAQHERSLRGLPVDPPAEQPWAALSPFDADEHEEEVP